MSENNDTPERTAQQIARDALDGKATPGEPLPEPQAASGEASEVTPQMLEQLAQHLNMQAKTPPFITNGKIVADELGRVLPDSELFEKYGPMAFGMGLLMLGSHIMGGTIAMSVHQMSGKLIDDAAIKQAFQNLGGVVGSNLEAGVTEANKRLIANATLPKTEIH